MTKFQEKTLNVTQKYYKIFKRRKIVFCDPSFKTVFIDVISFFSLFIFFIFSLLCFRLWMNVGLRKNKTTISKKHCYWIANAKKPQKNRRLPRPRSETKTKLDSNLWTSNRNLYRWHIAITNDCDHHKTESNNWTKKSCSLSQWLLIGVRCCAAGWRWMVTKICMPFALHKLPNPNLKCVFTSKIYHFT